MRRFIVERPSRLDGIAREIYGSERGGAVERLLEANPGLAELAMEVPAGTALDAPETVIPADTAIRPWA